MLNRMRQVAARRRQLNDQSRLRRIHHLTSIRQLSATIWAAPIAPDATPLSITHLNEDRRRINAAIREARHADVELTGESTRLTILESANLRDGELRKLETWSRNREAVLVLDNTYYRVDEIDKANRAVTLRDGEGDARLFSPKDAVREGFTLYHERAIDVAIGDRMRFLTSDVERGHVANSTWVELAYAITAHGAQGASERLAITLEGVEGRLEQMVNRASAYVALSRAKEHVQVYTDDEAGWLKAIGKVKARTTAHDTVLGMVPGSAKAASMLYGKTSPLDGTALGRAVLRGSRLSGHSLAHFVAPGKKYPQPHAILPAYDANGKPAGVRLAPLMDAQGKSLAGLPDQGRVLGSERVQFVTLQASANQETRLAASMKDGIALAARYPHSGLVVRLQGEGVPFNPQAMTGGRLWVGDATVQAVARPTESPLTLPETPEEKQQRALAARLAASAGRLERRTSCSGCSRRGNSVLRRCGTVCRTPWCVRRWHRCVSSRLPSGRWRGRMQRPAADCRPRHRVLCPMRRSGQSVSKKNAGRRLTYGD